MRRYTGALLAAVGLLAALAPAAAQAGTVTVDGVQVVFTAAPGETNEVSVSRPDRYVVDIHDDHPIAVPDGEPCVHPSSAQPGYVRCSGDGLDLLGGYEVDLGDGHDVFSAGPGWIYLGRVYGGAGNDIIHGPTGTTAQSFQQGGADNDQIFLYVASWGARGEDGADRIVGSGDPDTIQGGAGNDTLEGMGGDDSLTGGLNRDTVDGGQGSDWMSYLFDGRAGGVSVTTGDGIDDEGSSEDCTAMTFCRIGSGRDVVSGVEAWQGSQFGDTMTGGDGVDFFDGQGGADSLTGAGNDDHLDGADGSDSFDGGPGGDWMGGGDGTDVLDYSARTEAVRIMPEQGPGSGANAGAEGDEVGGFEEVRGGQAGDDIRIGCANSLWCPAMPLVKGGPGGDTVRLTCLPPPDDWACGRASRVEGEGGGDTLVNEGPHGQTIEGGEGADTVDAGSGVDTIDGGPGADDLDGGGGPDELFARDGTAEAVACGADGDEATTDSGDAVDADCEAVALTMLAAPAISGQALRGADLSATDGSWFGRPQTGKGFQWERCASSGACSAIPGATARSYRVVLADVDYRLRVTVSVPHPMGDGQASATTGVVSEAAAPPSGGGASGGSGGGTGGGAPAGTGAGDDGSTDPPPPAAASDTKAPTQTVVASGARRRGILTRGLRLALNASEAGRFTVTLSIGGRKAIARASKRMAGAGRAALRLRPSRRGRRALARARRGTLVLRVTFTDGAGNAAAPVVRRFRLR